MNDDFRAMFEEVNRLVEFEGCDPGEAIAVAIEDSRQRRIEYLENLTPDKIISEFDSKIDDEGCGLDRDIRIQEAMAAEIVKWRKLSLERLRG